MPPLIYPYPPTIFTAPGERAYFQGAEVAAR
jgi:hypothetical protein